MAVTGDTNGDAPVLDSEKGYDHSEHTGHDEPLTGETTERQPAWRPGGGPAGQGVYSDQQATSTGTEDEPEGPGI